MVLLVFYRILILSIAFIFTGCTSVFYQPTRVQYFNPLEGTGPKPIDLEFKSQDGTILEGWLFPHTGKGESKGLVIQFHGNAENMSSHFLSLLWVVNEGYDFMTFDYRGYGISEGKASPKGLYFDSIAALQKAQDLVAKKPRSVIVFGQSLGGAIALRAIEDLKDREFIRAVVIESSFSSYTKIAVDKLKHSWITWPLQWLGYLLVSNKYAPKTAPKSLTPIPVLVLHGTKDPVVPFKFGKTIFENSTTPHCFLPIETEHHAHLMNIDHGKYRRGMTDFFENQKCPSGLP